VTDNRESWWVQCPHRKIEHHEIQDHPEGEEGAYQEVPMCRIQLDEVPYVRRLAGKGQCKGENCHFIDRASVPFPGS